jgi:hypothetical protein
MTPKRLANELIELLSDGVVAITFGEIKRELKLTPVEIAHFRNDLYFARRRLDAEAFPTMLVSKPYFDLKREPTKPEEAIPCIALDFRVADGVRRLYVGKNNSVLDVAFLRLDQKPARGRQGHNLARIAIGFAAGKLTPVMARTLADEAGEIDLPHHEAEFVKLLGKINGELKQRTDE